MFLITMSSSRLQFNNALLTVLAVLPFDSGFKFPFYFLEVKPLFGVIFGTFTVNLPPPAFIIIRTIGNRP